MSVARSIPHSRSALARALRHSSVPLRYNSTSSGTNSSSSELSTGSGPSSSSSKYADFKASPSYRPASSSTPPPRSKLSRTLFILGWLPVAAFITSHLYSLGNVTGGSMSPTFNGPHSATFSANAPSDIVLLNRTVKYQHHELKAGDIVTLISPLDPRLLLTKRIIALPGDTVRVWVFGSGGGGWKRMKIPPGHVWVEGDAAVDIVPGSLERVANAPASSRSTKSLRTKSRDSREFGPVPMGLITSRIEAVVWPPERFGRPAPRPTFSSSISSAATPTRQGQYPPSETAPQSDTSTQVNPSLARILDEMTKAAPAARTKAHPEDSVISPFVDWSDPKVKQQEEGEVVDEESERERVEGEKERIRKGAWNMASRGGRLGDDAD